MRIAFAFAILAYTLLALVVLATVAFAQDFPPPAPQAPAPKCAPRSEIVYRLANQYGEFATWQGVDRRGTLIEWFGNPDTGTWTLIRTTPDMQACMISEGEGFSASMPVLEGEDA